MSSGGAASSDSPSIWRRVLRGALVVAGAVVLILGGFVVALQFDGFGTMVARTVARSIVPQSLDVSVERVSGSWLRSLEVVGLRISVPQGDTVVSIDTASAHYRLLPLLRRHVDVRSARVASPVLHLARQGETGIGIQGWPAAPPSGPGKPWRFSVRSIAVAEARGRLTTSPDVDASTGTPQSAAAPVTIAWSAVDLAARDLSIGNAAEIVVDTMRGRIEVPSLPDSAAVGPLDFNGAARMADRRVDVSTFAVVGPHTRASAIGNLAMPDSTAEPIGLDFDLTIDSLPLAIVHAALGNTPDPARSLSGRFAVGGTTALITADIEASTSDGGRITGAAAVAPGPQGPVSYRAELEVSGLDPATLTGDTALAGRLGGSINVDLAGQALASLDGHANASMDRFAVGPASLRTVQLTSSWTAGEAAIQLDLEGDDVAADVDGTIRPFDAVPVWAVHGPIRFRVPGDSTMLAVVAGRLDASGERLVPDSIRADIDMELDELGVMDARFESGRLTASLDSGTVTFRLAVEGGDTQLLEADGSATIAQPIAFRIDHGRIRELDIAALLGDSVPGRLDADITASGVLGEPEQFRSDVRLAVRQARYGPLSVDTTSIDARLADGRLRATGRAIANAGRIDFELSARPFLAPPRYTLTRGVFADVQLGVFAGDSAVSTRLAGTVTGEGRGLTIDQAVVDLDVRLDSSRVNRQRIAAGNATVALNESVADVRGSIEFADSGGVEFRVAGRPFADRPALDVEQLEFRALDPFAVASTDLLAGTPAWLNGELTGSVDGFDPRTMVADGLLRLAESRIGGETVSRAEIEWRARDSRLFADGSADLTTGTIDASADVTFTTDDVLYAIEGSIRSAGTELALTDATTPDTSAASIRASGSAIVSIDGRGTSLATMNTRIRAVADTATFGDISLDTVRVALNIERGVATIDTLTVRSNLAAIDGRGSAPVSDSVSAAPADMTIDATIRSLQPLRRWLGPEPAGLGTGMVHVAVTGGPGALDVHAAADANALLVRGIRVVGLDAAVDGRVGDGMTLASATGHLEMDRLDAQGLEIRLSRIEGEWDGDELALAGVATVDDRRDVAFDSRIDPRPGTARATIERFDFRADADQWQLAHESAISWADGLQIDSLSLRAGDQTILIDGLLDTNGRSDLRARINQFRIGSIADIVGYDDLDGALTASLDLQGSAAEPRITAGVDARLDWQGAESSVVAALSYDTLRLDIETSVRTDRDGTLTVTGGLPIDLALTRTAEGDTTRIARSADGPVDITVRADSFGIAWFEPFLDPTLARGLGGRLRIDARVDGTQAEPVLSGTIGLTDGRLTVPRLGVTYSDAMAAVTLADNVARIDSAGARAGDGTVSVDGTVSLAELSLGEFDVNARLDGFRVIHDDAFRVAASGNARLNGTTREPRLEGEIQLLETDVYLDNRLATGAVQPVELTDEQIRRLEEYFGMPVSAPERDASALYEALTIDLDVTMSRDTWVRQRANPQLELQLAGDVRVMKQPQDSLRFDGRVEAIPRRSFVEQFGRKFTIDQGVVELQGKASEARVDISASYRVPSKRDRSSPEATITLDVSGVLTDLELRLGSEPTMENADIVSYLATGRPLASSLAGGGGNDLGAIGSDIALSEVTGLVEGLAAQGVGLDVVEIEPEGLRGATIIAGRFVTPRVYVGFKQPIGRDPDESGAVRNFEDTEVEVEYEALRWLLLNMEASSSAVSLLFRYRHAY